MAAIYWTVGSKRDLLEIIEYINQDSMLYAALMAERIVSAVERLRQFPNLGRIVPEYCDEKIREIIIGNYRIIYEVRNNRVCILAIVHVRRNL